MSNVNLREVEKKDIEQIRIWRNSKEVSQYMYTDNTISKQDQESWFNKISTEKSSIYWIIEYDEKPVGLASINNIDLNLSSCYWAFYLGDTSIRGAGIGAKVEFKVIEYVFEVLNLNKLRCEVFVHNDKVIRMHEKFGFRREAYYREHCIKNNVKLDAVGLALLKNDWSILKQFYIEKLK